MKYYAKKVPSTSGRTYEVIDSEELLELFESDSNSDDYESIEEWFFYMADEIMTLPQGWEESECIYYYFDEEQCSDKSDTLTTIEAIKSYFFSEEQKELHDDYDGDFKAYLMDLDRWDNAHAINLIRC